MNLSSLLFVFYAGYYAEQLSSDDIVQNTDTGNSSSSIIRTTKTTKKSSHIYKLSYAGPIVMGVGGKYLHVMIIIQCRFHTFYPRFIQILTNYILKNNH